MSMTRPISKPDPLWMIPVSLSWNKSTLTYNLTLYLSMGGVHLVYHVSVLQKPEPYLVIEWQQLAPNHVKVESKEGWKVNNTLHRNFEYLIGR